MKHILSILVILMALNVGAQTYHMPGNTQTGTNLSLSNSLKTPHKGMLSYWMHNPTGDATSYINQALSEVDNLVFTKEYTVNGTVTVPAGKTLIFDNGGMLKGSGTITGNETGIQAGMYQQIFETSLTITGFNTDKFSVCWFGAKPDTLINSTAAIQRTIEYTKDLIWVDTTFELIGRIKLYNTPVYFPSGFYSVDSLMLYTGTSLLGADRKTSVIKQMNGTDAQKFISTDSINTNRFLTIEKLTFIGTENNTSIGLYLNRCSWDSYLQDVNVVDFYNNVKIVKAWTFVINNCHFERAKNINLIADQWTIGKIDMSRINNAVNHNIYIKSAIAVNILNSSIEFSGKSAILMDPGYYMKISGCWFEGNNTKGGYPVIHALSGASEGLRLYMSNNIFLGVAAGTATGTTLIKIEKGLSVVSWNNKYQTDATGIAIDADTSGLQEFRSSGDLFITNNPYKLESYTSTDVAFSYFNNKVKVFKQYDEDGNIYIGERPNDTTIQYYYSIDSAKAMRFNYDGGDIFVINDSTYKFGNSVIGLKILNNTINLGSGSNVSSGEYSITLGHQNTASGDRSTATGIANISSGSNSFTAGYNNQATATNCVAFGTNNKSLGSTSTVFGNGNECGSSAYTSFVIGKYNKATSAESFVGGAGFSATEMNIATGLSAFIFQRASSEKKAEGDRSVILGGQDNSTATTAINSVVLGGTVQNAVQANTVYVPALKIKTQATAPTSPEAGTIYFDGTHFQGYDGTAWKQLDN